MANLPEAQTLEELEAFYAMGDHDPKEKGVHEKEIKKKMDMWTFFAMKTVLLAALRLI